MNIGNRSGSQRRTRKRLSCRHRFPMFMRLEECAGMEAAQAVSEICETACAASIPAHSSRRMNIGNRCLQESLFRVLRCEPDRFPMFIRLAECDGIEAAHGVSENTVDTIQC